MSLFASLNIGQSALTASQIAIQVTGNNLANSQTPGYSRQIAQLAAGVSQNFGPYSLGQGVSVQGVTRQVDTALNARVNSAVSDQSAATSDQSLLSSIESTIGGLGNNDLTSQFTQFFSAWSSLANSPSAPGAAALVVQQGQTLASAIQNLRSNLSQITTQVDAQLSPAVSQANSLFSQIASLNQQIVTSQAGGSSQNNALQDSRDQLVSQLSQLMDVTVVPQPSGAVNVLVGSTPVVLGTTSRGVQLQSVSNGSSTTVTVNTADNGTQLAISSGQIGSLLKNRSGVATQTVAALDTVASQLIYQVNKLHSQGTSSTPITSVTGTLQMPASDTTKALDDPSNTTLANLPFKPVNGSFQVTVTNTQTGATQTQLIQVNLTGIQNNGTPGTADDTSVSSLAGSLNGVPNVTATVQPDGTLKINAGSGYSVSFSQDTSGVLAVLGINNYFTGTNASNIGVSTALQNNSSLLSAGGVVNGQASANATALAIAGLQTASNPSLGNQSIAQSWTNTEASVGTQSAAATAAATAAGTVTQALQTQQQAVSGVNTDEESINLLAFQRQYQGAAQFISTVDQMTQALLAITTVV